MLEEVVDERRLAVAQVEAVAALEAAMGDDHALGLAVGHLDVGRDRPRLVAASAATRASGSADRARDSRSNVLRPPIRLGRPISSAFMPIGVAPVERQHVVLGRLDPPQVLQLAQLLRVLRGEVVRLREVLVDVVELPRRLVGVELAADRVPRARTTATRPSSRRGRCPRLQPISKYCVLRRLWAFASSKV